MSTILCVGARLYKYPLKSTPSYIEHATFTYTAWRPTLSFDQRRVRRGRPYVSQKPLPVHALAAGVEGLIRDGVQ